MKKIITITLFLSLLFNLSKAQTGTYVPQLAKFDTAMQSIMTQYNVPGGQLAITYHGRLVYSRGFGLANTTTQDSVQPSSLFRIASVSKPVTGIAFMKLFQQGLVNLDAKVFGANGILNDAIYQTILDPRDTTITVRNLLQHSGGWNSAVSGDPMFDSYNIATTMGATPPANASVVIQYMLSHKMLDFNPGTQYQYSNFGFCVAGKVIEKITGQTYEDYVRNTILIPLGITDMQLGFNLLANQVPNEVNYYDYPGAPLAYSVYNNSSLVPWQYGGFNIEAMDAHGRWIASCEDLVKLMCAVDRYNPRPDIFTHATIDTMIKPSATNANYALGWNVNSNNNWWHLGSIPGTTAEIIRNGNSQINFAVLFNTRTQNVSDISGAADNLLWSVLPSISSWPSFDLFTGVDEIKNNVAFSLYPNPAKDEFTIYGLQFSNNIKTEIKVFDFMGKEIYSERMTTENCKLKTTSWSSGIYFIQLNSQSSSESVGVSTRKLIIQH